MSNGAYDEKFRFTEKEIENLQESMKKFDDALQDLRVCLATSVVSQTEGIKNLCGKIEDIKTTLDKMQLKSEEADKEKLKWYKSMTAKLLITSIGSGSGVALALKLLLGP